MAGYFPRSLAPPGTRADHYSNQGSSSVTIAQDPLGRSVKTVITGTRRYATHEMQSIKSGHLQSAENDGQFALAKTCEVRTDVVDFLLHPHRVDLESSSGTLSYIPTMARQFEDGAVEIVEMIGRCRRQHYPEAARREALVEYARRGWRFTEIDHDKACQEFKDAYMNDVYFGRRTAFTSRDHLRLTGRLLAAGGSATLEDAASAIGCRVRGELVLCAMMVRRMVEIDLARRLSSSSTVSLHDPTMPRAPGFRIRTECFPH